MPRLLDFFPQRRTINLVDQETGKQFFFAKDLPTDVTTLRMQESFKGQLGHGHRFWVLSRVLLKSVVLITSSITVLSVLLMYGPGMLLFRANDLGRQCFDVRSTRILGTRNYRYAMVTCTDGASGVPGRSFEGLMNLVAPNKRSYASRHGYAFIDASDLLDKNRPPSWSKILAVRKHLPNYDWVFWNDADSVVANPAITLDNIISCIVGEKEFDSMPDFIVTEDVTGVNAGMFFFRNSNWSMEFLDLWWNQTSFIRPFGECKSGDNDALKYLLKAMPKEEFDRHVHIPRMQCLFNSNVWSPTLKSGLRFVTVTKAVWQGVYSKGDFMVHLAGLDDKKTWMNKILRDIEGGRALI